MNSRYIGALVIAPMLIFVFLGGIYLYLFTLAISLIGLREFYKVIEQKELKPFKAIGYSLCVIYFIMLYFTNSLDNILPLNIFVLMILFCITVLKPEYNFLDVASTYVGYIYVAVFFSFLPLTNAKAFGAYLVWLPFIASWGCDTIAYYSGRMFGKHKLCPKVSPKKTVEGALGGLIGSTLLSGLFGYFINQSQYVMGVQHFILIGIICGVFCQFGDLVASTIKRYIGVKDYSNLIPGHGGILDRFDSILFSSVIVFYYLTYIAGI